MSLVEVLVALVILAIVTTSAVGAMTVSQHSNTRTSVHAQEVDIAQKVVDQLNADGTEQGRCQKGTWTPAARAGTADVAPSYSWPVCSNPVGGTATEPVIYKDAQEREYDVSYQITPIDDPSDGRGGATAPKPDADARTEDYFNVAVHVTVDQTSLANLSGASPVEDLVSRLAWSDVQPGSVSALTCAWYRPDRSLGVNSCSSRPSGVGIRLTPDSTVSGNSANLTYNVTSNGSGVASFASVNPGYYKVSATAPSGMTVYRAYPAEIHVQAGQSQGETVTLYSQPAKVQICGYLGNLGSNGSLGTPADPFDGYKANVATIQWQESGSPLYHGAKLTFAVNNPPKPKPVAYEPQKCATMTDPAGYLSSGLPKAPSYVVTVPQNSSGNAMTVAAAWRSNSGCGVTPPSSSSGNRLKVVPSADNPPASKDGHSDEFEGLYVPTSNTTQYLCFDFHSDVVPEVTCAAAASPPCEWRMKVCVPANCKPWPQCQLSGTPVPMTECTGGGGPVPPPSGSVGGGFSVFSTDYGGPNDSDVGGKCLMNSSGAGWFPGTGNSGFVSGFSGDQWVGGISSSSGHTASGAVFDCHTSYEFATYLYPMHTCLQLDFNGKTMRGQVLDRGAVGHVDTSIATAMLMDPDIAWNAYYWGGVKVGGVWTFPWGSPAHLTFHLVTGDSSCNEGQDATPVIVMVPPTIVYKYFDPAYPPGSKNPSTSAIDDKGNTGTGARNA